MFKVSCGAKERGGWEIAPTEFWQMTPYQWWQIWEFNVGPDMEKQAEHEADMERCRRLFFEAKAQEKNAA